MVSLRLRYIVQDRDRHGNVRTYFRRRGRAKIRIEEPFGSPEFLARYRELLERAESGKWVQPVTSATVRTFEWLADQYHTSQEFLGLDRSTQATRRRLMSGMLAEPIEPGSPVLFSAFPIDRITTASLTVLRDRKGAALPGAANDRIKALRALFKWAATERHVSTDPALGLQRVKVKAGSGHKTWTEADIARFEARHPPGTRAHLALMLMLNTGARRSDVVRLGKPHRIGDALAWTAHKNRNRHPVQIEIPILPPLAAALSRSDLGEVTFLVNDYGHPFTGNGFGNWFRDRCDEAGLNGLSAHGLRKAAATRAAEAGATAHQLMAIMGWKNIAEAQLYTATAERKRLARAGMVHVLRDRSGT